MRRLITIPISHYCEKARWALERAGLPYTEERHVQGVHQIVARRAGGRKTVPVLLAPEGVFAESEEILAYADESLPEELRLFPDEAALRAEVESLSRWLDKGLGPDARRVMYTYMLEQRRLMLKVNNQGVPRWEGAAMTAFWPVMVRFANRELRIDPAGPQKDEARVGGLRDDRRAPGRRSPLPLWRPVHGGRPHVRGISAAVTVPTEYGVSLPQPDDLPEPVASAVRAFRAHPAGAFALRIFREKHSDRPAAAATI